MQQDKPIAIYKSGIYTYIIYGAIHTTETTYPVLRIAEEDTEHTHFSESTLKESDRGSVDLKNDKAGTLALMAAINFG